MNWVIGILLDVFLVAIALLCIKKGSKDGFAKTIVSFAGIFVAIILAATLSKPLTEFAYTSFAQKPIETAVENTIRGQTDSITENAPSVDKLVSGIEEKLRDEKTPSFVKNLFGTEEKIAQLAEDIKEVYTSDITELSKAATEKVLKPVIVSIISAITFVLIFAITFLLCTILSKVLKIVNKLPLLGSVNSLLGGIIGFLKGLIIVLIINFVIVSLTSSGTNLWIVTAETVQSSLIMKNLALVNPLNSLLASVLAAK